MNLHNVQMIIAKNYKHVVVAFKILNVDGILILFLYRIFF